MEISVIEKEIAQLESRWHAVERAHGAAARIMLSGAMTLLLGMVAGVFFWPMLALALLGAGVLAAGLSRQRAARRGLQQTAELLGEQGRRLGALRAVRAADVPGTRVYYEAGQAQVTRAAVSVGARTFPLADIKAAVLAHEFPNPLMGLAGMAAGLVWSACPGQSLQGPLALLAAGDADAALAAGLVPLAVMAGIGLAVAALSCLYLISRPSYIVRLADRQHGRNVLITHDGLHALRVVQAVNEAVAQP